MEAMEVEDIMADTLAAMEEEAAVMAAVVEEMEVVVVVDVEAGLALEVRGRHKGNQWGRLTAV